MRERGMSPLFLPISSQWGQHTHTHCKTQKEEKEKHKSHIRQSSELTELGHLLGWLLLESHQNKKE